MQSLIYGFIEWLTYPPRLSLCVGAGAAVMLVLGWRKLAAATAVLALAWSVLWSLPHMSDWLNHTLAQRTEIVPEESLPRADAIVVLGGPGRYGWLKRDEVDADDLRHSRVAAGARAWLAGRAPIVVLSGGGPRHGPSEADAMAKAIVRLGVPESVLVLEERSHSTQDNARFTAELADQLGVRCILLVTSSVHMPRASLLFEAAGLEVVEFPAPVPYSSDGWLDGWLPSRSALRRSGRALKEYGALIEARLQLRYSGLAEPQSAGPQRPVHSGAPSQCDLA
jgi:uncharacterized SAM-binding protein YcdF (DUF218 family)